MRRHFKRKLKKIVHRSFTLALFPEVDPLLARIVDAALIIGGAFIVQGVAKSNPYGIVSVHPEGPAIGGNERQEGRSEVVGEIARPKLS